MHSLLVLRRRTGLDPSFGRKREKEVVEGQFGVEVSFEILSSFSESILALSLPYVEHRIEFR